MAEIIVVLVASVAAGARIRLWYRYPYDPAGHIRLPSAILYRLLGKRDRL